MIAIKNLLKGKIYQNKHPENYKIEDKHLFNTHFQTVIPDTNLYELTNVLYLPEIILLNNFFFKEVLTNRNLKNYRYLFKVFRNFICRPTKKLKGTYLLVIDDWSNGYFHWVTDVLQRILISTEYCEPNIKLLLPEYFRNNKYMVDSLSLFGFDIYYYPFKNNYKIEKLIIPGHVGASGFFHFDFVKKLSKYILSKVLLDGAHSKVTEKVYISRRLASKRKIINEEEIWQYLESIGYKIAIMENIPFIDQVKLMSNAKILVSLHGSGLTNALFMPLGAKVLEIRHPLDQLNNCFYLLSTALGLNYSYFLAESDFEDPHLADMTVNLEAFKQLVNQYE